MATSLRNSELGKASDFYEDISEVCQPCSVEGKSLQADRFCVDCKEYLCKKCSTYHKALKATRNHHLVTIDDTNKTTPLTTKDKCSYKCTIHKDKTLKYACKPHSYLGCSVCITMDHKQCKNVDYIPEVAEDIRNLDGFKKFDEKLKALGSSCKASIADIESNLKDLGADERQLIDKLKEYRIKMNSAFDKFEIELTTRAQHITIEETTALNVLSKKLAISLDKVETFINQVDNLLSSGKNCDTYVLVKKEASTLAALNDEFVNMTKDQTFKRYEFQPNDDIFNATFGQLSTRTVECRFLKIPWIRPPPPLPPRPMKAPIMMDQGRDTKDAWEISRESLQLSIKIGAELIGGLIADIWKGVLTIDDLTIDVAIMTQRPDLISKKQCLDVAEIMKKCRHERLVRLYGVCSLEEPFYTVTELLEDTLLNYLREGKGRNMKFPEMVDIAGQIAEGMAYLESNKIIHRDVAARNIFVGENSIVKVGNFDNARVLEDDEYTPEPGEKFPIKWTAPEAALYGRFTIKSDVWSYGILLVEITTHGQVPYPGMSNRDVIEQVPTGYRMPRPPLCSERCYEMIRKCWDKNPDDRPTFEFLYNFFDDYSLSIESDYDEIDEMQ